VNAIQTSMAYSINYSEDIDVNKLTQKITSLGFSIEEKSGKNEAVFWCIVKNAEGTRIAFQVKEKTLDLKLIPKMTSTYILSGILAAVFLFSNTVLEYFFEFSFGPRLSLAILAALTGLPIFIKRQMFESNHLFVLEELDKQLDEI
jgi:hypothetical protein